MVFFINIYIYTYIFSIVRHSTSNSRNFFSPQLKITQTTLLKIVKIVEDFRRARICKSFRSRSSIFSNLISSIHLSHE